jgi:hypothetical protein
LSHHRQLIEITRTLPAHTVNICDLAAGPSSLAKVRLQMDAQIATPNSTRSPISVEKVSASETAWQS